MIHYHTDELLTPLPQLDNINKQSINLNNTRVSSSERNMSNDLTEDENDENRDNNAGIVNLPSVTPDDQLICSQRADNVNLLAPSTKKVSPKQKRGPTIGNKPLLSQTTRIFDYNPLLHHRYIYMCSYV